MLKKKARLVVSSSSSDSEHTITPDFMNNLELDESAKMKIVLKKLNNFERLKMFKFEGGKQVEDHAAILRMSVKEIINPPIIEIDGKERDMTVDDFINVDELYILALNVYTAILQFNNWTLDKGE
jgi:hypothetical protein